MSESGSAAHVFGADGSIDPSALVVVVVGAHVRAEVEHRSIAYRLTQTMDAWLGNETHSSGMATLVCSDVWYLNDDRLRECASVSIGGPEVNALTAYLVDKLPVAFAIDDVLAVHVDVEMVDAMACVWGVDAASTEAAVTAFGERYLTTFMRRAVSRQSVG